MEAIQDIYPVFEANQVLANTHLNQSFDYLEEQVRLTRANLIGIGIVCGLEIRLDASSAATTIHLYKGCGVTSQGYLIVEPRDVTLVSYRKFMLPDDLDYPSFKDGSQTHKPYDLWELFPARESGDNLLGSPAAFLKDKVFVLFLELKKEGLRNCSPNNCDDKGEQITATTRRLLIKVDDLTKIIAEANQLEAGVTFADLETALLARLDLPDLRLPRYDVANSGLATSNEVLAAFHAVFHTEKLAGKIRNALTAAYNAFKPVLQATYPNNPFANFTAQFGFLDDAPKTTVQVRFLQYYYDFFDDLLKAYEEFRGKGAELMCACCSPEGLFPRHLMLGVLFPATVSKASLYRQPFLASSAVSNCEERAKELIQLFRRIVEMIEWFSNPPKLADASSKSDTDLQIRVTPSKLGDAPISERAIPYYYHQDGTPPLFHLWNVEKTRRNKANQNLSYRSDEYQPPAPAFVTNALSYELEPYDFIRIEGHLGKDYKTVVNTLLSLKSRYRLPIEVIALRTGAFDERMFVDVTKENCRFQDLETLYDTLREELLSTVCEGMMNLYNISLGRSHLAAGAPEHPLLKKYAPNFRYAEGTVGAWYEKYLTIFQPRPYVDVDQNKIDINAVLTVYCFLFAGTADLPDKYFPHVVSIYYLTKLAEVLPASLDALGYADFENKYQDLMSLIRYFRTDAKNNIADELKQFVPQKDLIDQFDQVLFSCKLEPIKAVHEEYVRRIREVKQKQFLSFFLQKNPSIQHKAGVPFGGTFIIVYHEEPLRLLKKLDVSEIRDKISRTTAITQPLVDTVAIANALNRISAVEQFVRDPDINFLIGSFTGQVPDRRKIGLPRTGADEIIESTVNEFANGTVIADFYLPYICCSDCSPIQFTLPKSPLTLTLQIGCTDPEDKAEVTVTPKGGSEPYTYKLDDADEFLPLTGKLLLNSGLHSLVVQDAVGTESAPRSVTIPGSLTVGTENYRDDTEAKTYQVSFDIVGGTAPYKAEPGTVVGNKYNSPSVDSDEAISVTVTDNLGCVVTKEFTHTVALPCDLPCGGQSRWCAYRLWVQPPLEGSSYDTYSQDRRSNIKFRFNGIEINLAGTTDLLNSDAAQLNRDFHGTITPMIKKLNAVINQVLDEKFGQLSKPRLMIVYKPSETDPFGVLWIEYFVCETFNIEFNYSFAKPNPAFSLTWRYTNERDADGPFNGAILINRRLEKETRIPALDCSERNQCTGSEYKKLCEGPAPKLKLSMEPLGDNRFSFKGEVINMPASEMVAWVWDVFNAQPTEPFYEGDKVEAQLQQLNGPVRLTAITQKGCFGVTQQNIER